MLQSYRVLLDIDDIDPSGGDADVAHDLWVV
jgi:hypothetical protein